jgi:hypothetical protein
MGEVMISIDADLFHAYRVQMKDEMNDPDYECWDDPEFCKWIHRECPEVRGVNKNKIVSSKGLVA